MEYPISPAALQNISAEHPTPPDFFFEFTEDTPGWLEIHLMRRRRFINFPKTVDYVVIKESVHMQQHVGEAMKILINDNLK